MTSYTKDHVLALLADGTAAPEPEPEQKPPRPRARRDKAAVTDETGAEAERDDDS